MPRQEPKAKTKFFISPFDGEEIRLTLPDGGVAIVGNTPKELPDRFWRKALSSGCQPADEKPLTNAQKRAALAAAPENDTADDATLIERLKAKIREIFNADPNDPRFENALTGQDIPAVAWLSEAMGQPITSAQRDEAYALFEAEDSDNDSDEDEDEEDEEGQE